MKLYTVGGRKEGEIEMSRPKGRPGSSDVSPLSAISGLSFDSTFLSAALLFCQVLLLILSSPFSYFPEMSLNFFLEIGFFVFALFLDVLLAAR